MKLQKNKVEANYDSQIIIKDSLQIDLFKLRLLSFVLSNQEQRKLENLVDGNV